MRLSKIHKHMAGAHCLEGTGGLGHSGQNGYGGASGTGMGGYGSGGTNGWGSTDANNAARAAAEAQAQAQAAAAAQAQAEADAQAGMAISNQSSLAGLMGHPSDQAMDRMNAQAFGRAENSLANADKTEGGFFSGGLLGGLLSGLNTVAGFAVPGYAPISMGLGLANNAVGLSNSLGLSDTGSIGPSLGDAVGSVKDSLGGLMAGDPGATAADPSLGSQTNDPSGMLGNLQGSGHDYNPLADALAQQRSGPAATTPATSMPVQPGVPDPRSLAGLMAKHNPMTPVQRPLAPMRA